MSTNLGQLLYSGYQYGRLKLDLYGLRATEDEGHIVINVTLAGNKVNATYLVDDEALDEMAQWLDDEIPRINREEYLEAKAERIAYDRLMSMYDHQRRLV
ncbi:MAG: hypothetical protein ACXU89_22680 [Xanthobacteraceae bacterium]